MKEVLKYIKGLANCGSAAFLAIAPLPPIDSPSFTQADCSLPPAPKNLAVSIELTTPVVSDSTQKEIPPTAHFSWDPSPEAIAYSFSLVRLDGDVNPKEPDVSFYNLPTNYVSISLPAQLINPQIYSYWAHIASACGVSEPTGSSFTIYRNESNNNPTQKPPPIN